jgi:hypothetical protein
MTDVACVFVIGGARLYRETIGMIECTRVHHTQVFFFVPSPTPSLDSCTDSWRVRFTDSAAVRLRRLHSADARPGAVLSRGRVAGRCR